jgi:hypothetical protein
MRKYSPFFLSNGLAASNYCWWRVTNLAAGCGNKPAVIVLVSPATSTYEMPAVCQLQAISQWQQGLLSL